MGIRSAFTKEKVSDKNFIEECKLLYDNTTLDSSKKRTTDVYKYTDAELKQLWDNDPRYISEYAMKKLAGKYGGKNTLKKNSDYIKEGYHRDMVNYARAEVRGTKKTIVISEGTVLKRYGSEYGKFLAGRSIPFEELQLPYSEDKYKGRLSYYKVANPFKVTESTIAKQFTPGKEGQPVDSNSKQYKLKGFHNVNDMVRKGYLIRLDGNSGGMDMKNKFEAKESKIDNIDKGEKNLGSNKPDFDKHCGSVVDKFKSKFSPANKVEKNTKNQEAKGENKGEKPKESFKERFIDRIKNRKMEKKAASKEGDNKKDNDGESKVVNQILYRPPEKTKANSEINKNTVEKKTENKEDNKQKVKKNSDVGNDGSDGNAAEANVDKGRERVREPGRSGGETTEDRHKKEGKQKEADEKKKKAEAEAGNQEQNKRFNAFQQLLDNYKKKQEAKKEQKEEYSEDKENSEKEKTEKEQSKDSSEKKQEDPKKAFADYLKSFSSPEAIKASKERENQIAKYNKEHGNDVKSKEPGGKTPDDDNVR